MFVALSFVMAFVIGILWEKVSSLEKGGTKTTTTTAGTNNAQAQPQAAGNPASKLADLASIAKAVGVDENKFNECVASNKYEDKVASQTAGGVAAGVSGTPATFIVNQKGEAWLIPGALPYDRVKPMIDLALGKITVAPTGTPDKLTSDVASKIPTVNLASEHVRGSKSPSLYLIEYSDFECPFCQRFHPTVIQVLDEYSEVALVYRHFPLEQLHPYAKPAAIASECITELGGNDAFWKFADEVFGS